jgi:hypothetical protein
MISRQNLSSLSQLWRNRRTEMLRNLLSLRVSGKARVPRGRNCRDK